MQKIVLEKKTNSGDHLQATFLPEKGMNLISYKKNDVEVIAQSTWDIFEERYAGLGALIGPHFHRRPSTALPVIKNENLFPHIARVKAKGVQDPFSHGIARYAPWRVESSTEKLQAKLSGNDKWHDNYLADLEGQNFDMYLDAELNTNGLNLKLSICSEKNSLVGLHYYYALPNGKGLITAQIENVVCIEGKWQHLPKEWQLNQEQVLKFDLNQPADYTFLSYPNSLKGTVLLETETYQLHTYYFSHHNANCWQLFHPQDASFVCIEPISSKDPRSAQLNVSEIEIQLIITI